jgi:hypothetical protein
MSKSDEESSPMAFKSKSIAEMRKNSNDTAYSKGKICSKKLSHSSKEDEATAHHPIGETEF